MVIIGYYDKFNSIDHRQYPNNFSCLFHGNGNLQHPNQIHQQKVLVADSFYFNNPLFSSTLRLFSLQIKRLLKYFVKKSINLYGFELELLLYSNNE